MKESSELGEVVEKLKAIAQHVLDASLLRCHVVSEEKTLPSAKKKLENFLNQIKNSGSSPTQYLVRQYYLPPITNPSFSSIRIRTSSHRVYSASNSFLSLPQSTL